MVASPTVTCQFNDYPSSGHYIGMDIPGRLNCGLALKDLPDEV